MVVIQEMKKTEMQRQLFEVFTRMEDNIAKLNSCVGEEQEKERNCIIWDEGKSAVTVTPGRTVASRTSLLILLHSSPGQGGREICSVSPPGDPSFLCFAPWPFPRAVFSYARLLVFSLKKRENGPRFRGGTLLMFLWCLSFCSRSFDDCCHLMAKKAGKHSLEEQSCAGNKVENGFWLIVFSLL